MDAITILDGGTGRELHRIGAPFRQPEWSALALMERPETVVQAHRNFIDAGAQVVITNAYAVVPFHLGPERFAARGVELAGLAGRLARQAADAGGPDGRPVRVAGSLPPLFGSYAPEAFDPAAAPAMWRTLVEAQAPHVDLWVGETLASTAEARVLLDTLDEAVGAGTARRPVWLAFTVLDHDPSRPPALRSGEPVTAVADLLAARRSGSTHGPSGGPAVDAVLVNCSQPEAVAPALAALAEALGPVDRPALGAYANAFADHDPQAEGYAANAGLARQREDLTAERYATLATGWVAAGARIVGGCCGIHPVHIAALAPALAAPRLAG